MRWAAPGPNGGGGNGWGGRLLRLSSKVFLCVCHSTWRWDLAEGCSCWGASSSLWQRWDNTSQCSPIFGIFFLHSFHSLLMTSAQILKVLKSCLEFVLKELHHKRGGKFHLFLSLFHVAIRPQLLYTGIVIYAPALILNQGKHESHGVSCFS